MNDSRHNPYSHETKEVRLKSAWLISWMGTEPWARPGDWRSIMAIISGKRSAKFIKEVLWLLDVRAKNSCFGMTYYANRRSRHGWPVRCGSGWRMGGANAWLYARQVKDLLVVRDDRCETIQWTEPDLFANHPDTPEIERLQRGKLRSVSRDIDEYIGGEPYHRCW